MRFSPRIRLALVGGDGTNMGAGISAACSLRPRSAVCVVLADGYAPWPSVPPKGMRVVAALIGEAAAEGPSWARCVRASADQAAIPAGTMR